MDIEKKNAAAVAEIFKQQFNATPLVVRSPGRVNIIGEHTDYNEGFVLPAAIDKAIYVAVGKRSDAEVHLYAVDFKERITVAIADIKPSNNWSTYVLGVVDQLIKRGHLVGGFNLVLDGDVPLGAGLSSSAAVECATVFALNEVFGFAIDKMEMVKIAQIAEQTYSGVMCGIMDMFASMFGKKDQVIKLDCRSLAYEYKPFSLHGYKIVLFNTNVKHSLASSAYNERRQQCEQGVAWIKAQHPQVNSLRDVTMQMVEQIIAPKDATIYLRCKFIVAEIDRLLTGCNDLDKGDIVALGKKMFATHEGLSKEYAVSCKELDYLVDAVKHNPDVLGSRMMGGGFGGCTINLVKVEAIEALSAQISFAYQAQFNIELSTYITEIENGTCIMVV